MKKFIVLLFIIQGVLVSAVIDHLTIKDIKIPVIYEQDKTLPIVSMQLIFQTSGSIEDGTNAGLARFSAKILNEGTKELGSVGFASLLENSAISLSAHSGTETFVIELSSLKEQFEQGTTLLHQLLADPNFSEESFDKVKIMMLGNLKQKESDFDYIANLNLKKLMYKDTPIGHAFSGSAESLNNLNLKNIENFVKNHIVLDRAIIVIGGDLSINESKKYILNAIKDLTKGKNGELKQFSASKKPETITVEKETQQAYIYFGSPYHLDGSSEEVYKAKVAAFILGAGGFGSRLMEEVRVKRGLAYSAYARVNLNRSYSDFSGHLQTKLESGDEAIKLVKEIIKEFTKNGVTKDELEQAKKFLLGSEPLRNEILSQRLSRSFMEYYKGLEIGHTKKELEKIEKLTLRELNDFIKSHEEINDLSFSIVTKK